MLSESVKNRIDYKIVCCLINQVLDTNGPNGSIAFGKRYAIKYKNMLDEMLSDNEVKQHLLHDLRETVDIDLTDVRADCKRRVQTPFTHTNDEMMSMITDFVKSL